MQFVRWLRQNGRLDRDPLAGLKGGNVRTDRRHIRRTLPADQLAKLLDTARGSQQMFRGLGGDTRYHADIVALATGFRLEEVAGLCPEDFDLTADPPTVRLAAVDTKNRQGANQPLPQPTADLLASYLGSKPVGQPIWPGTWGTRGTDTLKLDLKAAGIPYSVQGPDGPEFFDFHAQRATDITMLVQSGVTVKEAQVLARHSDPRLTLNVYTKLQMGDLAAAADRLPNLPAGPTRQPADLRPRRLLPGGVSDLPRQPTRSPAAGSPLTPRLIATANRRRRLTKVRATAPRAGHRPKCWKCRGLTTPDGY